MKVNFESIYEHIGILLYGIACKNGSLSTEDRLRLTEFIEKNWRGPVTADSLSLHLVDCIHGGVRHAIVNSMGSASALQSFADYYRIHTLPFGDALKKRIVTSALQLVAETRAESKSRIESYLAELLNAKPIYN